MRCYFRRIDWLTKRANGHNEVNTVQFALVREEDGGTLETAAIFDICYLESDIDECFQWESTRLFIKPELIGLEGLAREVREGKGLEPQEAANLFYIWENFFKITEDCEKLSYPIEYWEYCQDKFSLKIKQSPENMKIVKAALELTRKIYDALDGAGYHLDAAELPLKYQLRLRHLEDL